MRWATLMATPSKVRPPCRSRSSCIEEECRHCAGSGRGVTPGNPATWRLPIEAYLPAKADTRSIAATRDSLIDECMKAAGYDQWTPAPDLPEMGGKTLTDWRYGLHDAGLAAKRGYHPDAAEQRAYDEAQEAGAVDESGADDTTLKGCVAQADGKAPSAQPDALAQQISDDSYLESMNAPSAVDAFSMPVPLNVSRSTMAAQSLGSMKAWSSRGRIRRR